MISIIIGTHGLLSEELLKSSEMIFGTQSNISTVTFLPGEGLDDLIAKYNFALSSLDSRDGILFMVDIFGGSPFNAASLIALENENMEVIAGVNLPMLIEVFSNVSLLNIKDLSKLAEISGKESIKKLTKIKKTISKEDEL